MRKNIKPWALVAFLAVISIPSVSLLAAEKKPMTFVDAINIKRISSLRLSPDSSQPLPCVLNLSYSRISVFPEIEEFLVMLYGFSFYE